MTDEQVAAMLRDVAIVDKEAKEIIWFVPKAVVVDLATHVKALADEREQLLTALENLSKASETVFYRDEHHQLGCTCSECRYLKKAIRRR